MERYVGRILMEKNDKTVYDGSVFLHQEVLLERYPFLFEEIERAQENAMGSPTIDSIEIVIKSHDE